MPCVRPMLYGRQWKRSPLVAPIVLSCLAFTGIVFAITLKGAAFESTVLASSFIPMVLGMALAENPFGRQRTNDAIGKSEALLRAIFDHMSVGVSRSSPVGQMLQAKQEL